MNSKSYRLPGGKRTSSGKLCRSTWQDYINKLEQIFKGYTVDAFDPNFRLTYWVKNEMTGSFMIKDSFTLSVFAADKIIEKFNGFNND